MNNAYLDKLSVRPGRLEPDFSPDLLAYFLVLPSDTKFFLIDPVPSDGNASWTVMGLGCKRQIHVRPGIKKTFIIEVTAEDGTSLCYTLAVNCLSTSEASLSELTLSIGEFDPPFANEVLYYLIQVPWYSLDVEISAVPTDKNSVVTFIGISKGKVNLNYGETTCEIEVTSSDKKAKKNFLLKFSKQRLNFCVCPLESDGSTLNAKFQCPVCLNVPHCPRIINDSQPVFRFCKICLETITRKYPYHPILHVPLFENFMCTANNGEKETCELKVLCPYSYYGCTDDITLPFLGDHIAKCARRPMFGQDGKGTEDLAKDNLTVCRFCSRKIIGTEREIHLKFLCLNKVGNSPFLHYAELRSWERALQQQYQPDMLEPREDSDDGKILTASPDRAVQKLVAAAKKFATAINLEPKTAKLHYKLGSVFEEIHFARDVFGVEQEFLDDGESEEGEDEIGLKVIELGGESAAQEEILAICQARKLPASATAAEQLLVLDEEYHYLLEQYQSSRADYVQKLYTWKARQLCSMETKEQRKKAEESFLHKAYLKYLDAAFYDQSKYTYHLHVGRHLILQKKYQDASKRLQMAVGLNPTNVQARFYLALALSYLKDQSRMDECLAYFRDGIDVFTTKIHQENRDQVSEDVIGSFACNFVSHTNTLLLEGMLQYAKLLSSRIPLFADEQLATKIRIQQILHLISVTGIYFLQCLYHFGDTARQIQILILKAQYTLGTFQFTEAGSYDQNDKRLVKAKHFWIRLSSLMKSFCLPISKESLELEKKICEEAVFLEPCSSQALYRLAENRLAIYDNDNKQKKYLKEAEAMYRLSIKMEGTSPASLRPDPNSVLENAPWYKEKLSKAIKAGWASPTGNNTTTTEGPDSTGTKNTGGGKKGNKLAVKPVQGGRSGSPTKPIPAVLTPSSKEPTSTENSDQDKVSDEENKALTETDTKTVPPENEPSPKAPTPEPPNDKTSKLNQEENKTEASDQVENVGTSSLISEEALLGTNEPAYQARLGLARVLIRYHEKHYEAEIKELYKIVIEMAPYIHDAYIELGEIFAEINPMKAVDLYASYPFSQNTSLDDAYLHGEIVRHLMNGGYFKDPRLGTSMVMYGNALGLSVLEDYVSKLETNGQILLLKQVFATINGKSIDDNAMQEFYSFRGWV